jgi:hypothetical protein
MRKTTEPAPQERPADFIEAHRPRHEPIEALRNLIAAPPEVAGKSFLEYVGAFAATADTTKTRPTNLLDLYAQDIREVYLDAQRRPEHYDERQHEMLNHLQHGAPLSREMTDEEKNELLLTYMRRTISTEERERKIREQDRQRKRREQEENEDIVLEDGRSLAEAIEDEKNTGTFEKQDFGDKIIV